MGEMSISSSWTGGVEVGSEGRSETNVVLRVRDDDGHGGGLARGKVLSKSNVSISYHRVILGVWIGG